MTKYISYVLLVDCIWSLWSPCNVSCGSGVQSRNVQISNQDGGQNCLGDSTRPCTEVSSCPVGNVAYSIHRIASQIPNPKSPKPNCFDFCVFSAKQLLDPSKYRKVASSNASRFVTHLVYTL